MANFKNDPGFGQLFKNKYKTDEKHPTHKGSFTDPTGKEWDLSAWVKEGQNGKFFSLSIREPYVSDKPQTTNAEYVPDEEIPF